MQRVKKLIAYVLTIALAFGTVSSLPAGTLESHAVETEQFAYEFNEDGTVTITEAKQGSGDIIVPYSIHGHLVTAIGSRANQWGEGRIGAFQNKWETENVYLPETITTFGERAFAACSVKHIYQYTLPEGAVDSLAPVDVSMLPEGEVATSGAVLLPETENIASESALGCPNALTTIGKNCFDTSKLEEIQLSSAIKDIDDCAFYNTNVKEFVIPEGAQVNRIGSTLFNSSVETVVIKGTVAEIAEKAFHSVASLKTVTLEATGSIGSIGANCFQNSNATDFYFYGRVDSLGSNVFEGAGGIVNLYMEDVGVIGAEAFKNCRIQNVTLKGSVTSIGDSAFVGCGSLEKVVVDSKTPYTIGKYAFSCSSIKEVVFSDGLTTVQEGTFSGCGQLENVYLPSTLTSIEKNAFENVSTIKEITINDTAIVDADAFKGAGGTTWAALDRLNNKTVKSIVDKALNRSVVTPTPSAKPVKVSAVKWKKAKRNKKKTKAVLQWSKSSNATGYIIYVKTVKKGKKASKVSWKKVKKITKKTKTKLTVKLSKSQKKVLKKKGKIYFRIRAYKTVTVNGKKKTYYSKYTQKRLK